MNRFQKNMTINKHIQELIRNEEEQWKKYFTQDSLCCYILILLIIYNLAFHGTNEKFNVENSKKILYY